MRIVYGFENLPEFRAPVVTVGSYDGVHSGHRRLLGCVKDVAAETGGETMVVTFSPHPRQVLPRGGDIRLLNSIQEKAYLLDEFGIDNMLVVPFDLKFSRISSRNFVKEYLLDKIGMKAIVAGYNHRFGHDKEGGSDTLGDLSAEYGFRIVEQPQLKIDDRKISSTEVRKLIEAGEMQLAAKYLTRGYIMIADVSCGVVYFSEKDKLLPADGRYEVRVNGWNDTIFISRGNVMLEDCKQGRDVLIEFV